jgi:hypothetical protein
MKPLKDERFSVGRAFSDLGEQMRVSSAPAATWVRDGDRDR